MTPTARTPTLLAVTFDVMRVLAIDGGGIRGLIPALVLAELERRAGRRTFELFDLIAGTSTGSILACALCAPDPMPASRLVALYTEEGPEIFDRSIFSADPKR
jgi:patatin-like phospholipase/acyl hydrolase